MRIKQEENNMSINMTPARGCRLLFYRGDYFEQHHLIPDDFDFNYHEDKLYKLSLEIKESEESKSDLEKSKTAIFMVSTGLFCFGHLDEIDNIINYYQLVPRSIKTMVGVLRQLLPLPQNIGINTPDLLKQWLSDNKNRLEWSEQEGRYLLREI
jgi:hypothetical protein